MRPRATLRSSPDSRVLAEVSRPLHAAESEFLPSLSSQDDVILQILHAWVSALGILLAPGLRGALLASSSTSLSSSDTFPPLLAASFLLRSWTRIHRGLSLRFLARFSPC